MLWEEAHDGVACIGECDITSGELKEAQKAGADLMQDRDELSAQLASVEQQLADTTQAHDDYKYVHALFCFAYKNTQDIYIYRHICICLLTFMMAGWLGSGLELCLQHLT